jgi:hypothetical protein
MVRYRACAVVLALLLLTTPQASALAKGPGKDDKPGVKVVKIKRDGDAFCFERAIAIGSVVIAGGRCYTFYLTRTTAGVFLAFGPPGPPMIPPGQIVRMGTPAGAKMKGRLFYLVAVPVPVIVIQVDTIRFVPVVVTPQPGKVIITIPGTASGGQARDTDLAFSQL